MKPKKILLLTFIAAMVACSTEAELEFRDWDDNNDGTISREEYEETRPYLDLYNEWDLNDNSLLNKEEWQKAVDLFYPDLEESDYGSFSEWDKDNDQSVDDLDFGQRIFELWDMDNSKSLDLEEFNTWYPEYIG